MVPTLMMSLEIGAHQQAFMPHTAVSPPTMAPLGPPIVTVPKDRKLVEKGQTR